MSERAEDERKTDIAFDGRDAMSAMTLSVPRDMDRCQPPGVLEMEHERQPTEESPRRRGLRLRCHLFHLADRWGVVTQRPNWGVFDTRAPSVIKVIG